MTGIEIIAEERRRQIEEEGWTAEHDDTQNGFGELADAAACYAMHAADIACGPDCVLTSDPAGCWPWEDCEWWKPSANPIRDLAKAGALIAAEIDRIQRIPRHTENQR